VPFLRLIFPRIDIGQFTVDIWSLGIEPADIETIGSFDRLESGFKHRYCGRFILRVDA